jgi:RNA polymerase sigma factor (sigma-70 family)
MGDRPEVLDALLGVSDAAARERAWENFVHAYTPIMIAAIRAPHLDRDAVMDAYAHVLEMLRADDCRRVRAYRVDGPGKFTTWLTVVARRLAVDYHRQRYGRPRGQDPDVEAAYAARRRLARLVGADEPIERIPAEVPDGPSLVETERRDALERALSALAPRDRMLIRLRFEDDAPVRDIARLAGFPTVFHVYRQLNRVLAELRGSLTRSGIEDAAP